MEKEKVRFLTCKCPDDIEPVASRILKMFPKHKKFALTGTLGSGKTAFIKAFCRILGVREEAQSPTFTLMNLYEGPPRVAHFDFYRIEDPEEVYDLGFEEYFDGEDYVFAEWAERVETLLPADFIHIKLTISEAGSERLLQIE